MKRICFICGNYYEQFVGGAEYQLYLLAQVLSRMLYDVFYIYIDSGDKFHKNLNINLVPIKKRKILRWLLGNYFFLDYSILLNTLKKIDPDIIYQRVGFAYTGIAAKYALLYNKISILHISSDNDLIKNNYKISKNILFQYVDKKFIEYSIKNSHFVICQSNNQKHLLKTNYNRECSIIYPNSHPPPTEKYNKSLPIKIVWVANIKSIKKPELFIKLTNHFKNNNNVLFLMIGHACNNKYKNYLLNKSKKIDNFKYLGKKSMSEVNEILAKSHILINTSETEGYPNVFIQAWLRRVPVISLNVNPDNVLELNKIGFHSKTFDQMIENVHLLINNNKLREEMGERAMQYAFNHHILDNNINNIISFLNNVV